MEPFPGHDTVFWIYLDADVPSAETLSHYCGRAAAYEWIQNDAIRRTAGQNTKLDQFLRKNSKMSVSELGKRNFPHCAAISTFGVKGLIPSSIVQIRVAGILALFGCAVLLAEMIPSPPHPTLRRKGYVWLSNGVNVVIIIAALGKQKDVFVVRRRSILDRRRHGVGFVPDNVRAEYPTIIF